jgi:hypothetical protein
MKLRIEKNSLRLRLSAEDIERFVADGRLEESCSFGSEMELVFVLEIGGSALAASFDECTLAIAVPRTMAETLTLGGGIGFERTQLNDDGSSLSIVVERDLGRKQAPLPVSR